MEQMIVMQMFFFASQIVELKMSQAIFICSLLLHGIIITETQRLQQTDQLPRKVCLDT